MARQRELETFRMPNHAHPCRTTPIKSIT